MLTLLDLDPNLVRAGWLPLGLVVLLGLCIVGLYLSMRHEVKKVDVPYRSELPDEDAEAQTHEPAPSK